VTALDPVPGKPRGQQVLTVLFDDDDETWEVLAKDLKAVAQDVHQSSIEPHMLPDLSSWGPLEDCARRSETGGVKTVPGFRCGVDAVSTARDLFLKMLPMDYIHKELIPATNDRGRAAFGVNWRLFTFAEFETFAAVILALSLTQSAYHTLWQKDYALVFEILRMDSAKMSRDRFSALLSALRLRKEDTDEVDVSGKRLLIAGFNRCFQE
jgi:hypothetical protein